MEGEKEMKWQLATLYTLVILFRIKIKDEKNTYIFFYQKGLVMKKNLLRTDCYSVTFCSLYPLVSISSTVTSSLVASGSSNAFLTAKNEISSSVSDPDPLHLAGSGSTSIPAPDPDPDPDPLRFFFQDPDPYPLKKALIWIRVAPKLFRVISKAKCFCYLRNAFSKFWR